MYWPVGIPRIYEIAELHSHINSLETNDQQKKLLNEDLSTSEKENLVKTANADALSSIDVCDHSLKSMTIICRQVTY